MNDEMHCLNKDKNMSNALLITNIVVMDPRTSKYVTK